MNNDDFFRTFDALRNDITIDQMVEALVEVSANLAGDNIAFEYLDSAKYISAPDVKSAINTAADALLRLPRVARYDTISQLFTKLSDNRFSGLDWMHADASAQLIKLIGSATRANFSYSWAMRPCLEFILQAAEAGTQTSASFYTPDIQNARFMQRLAEILEMSSHISVTHAWSWERSTISSAEVEVIIPPMGMIVSNHEKIPDRTLACLGLKREKIGRLMADTLCLADALSMVPGKSIIVTLHGPLFRMVGTETIARESLLESGRLSAILNLPSRIMFEETTLETAMLILNSQEQKQSHVRMIDLKHKDVSARGRRGRYETLPEVVWADLIECKPTEDTTLLRDISHSEIRDDKLVLVPSRYLSISTKNLLEEFLATTQHQSLDTLVEFVRPISIRPDEDGEYTLLESMPSDCGDDGILKPPSRTVRVDEAKYNQTRHLRLIAGDVVLSVKGNVGAVAVVPDDAPLAGEPSVWTVGQSMMILRRRSPTTDPVALYEYLSNEVVQDHLKSLAFGSTLPSIAMKDLKDLPIALPDKGTIAAIHESRSRQAEIKRKIYDLQAEIEADRYSQWPHTALKLPSN